MLSGIDALIEKAYEHLHNEFNKIQTGRANPAMLESVRVLAYGSLQPLNAVANVSIMDSQTISIQPWDKAVMKNIEKGIIESNLGLNPGNNGETILVQVPMLTEERRRDLVKVAKKTAEEARVAVRNIRSDYHKKIMQGKNEKEITEDESKNYEIDIQKHVDTANKKIDEMLSKKEADILKV